MSKQARPDFAEYFKLVAHRGLHDNPGGVPENSMAAFRRAVERGHAIELDVHVTADSKLVVFHDEKLDRMCGIPGQVEEWTLADLKKLRLLGTEERIPTLDEVLELVDGAVPLLIEIKNYKRENIGRLEKPLAARLERYKGRFILESFNPEVLVWLHRYAPQFIRGQLADGESENGFYKFYSDYLLYNPLTKPDFIAFYHKKIDHKLRLSCKKRGLPLLGWTIRNQADLDRALRLCDGIIYEKLDL